MNSYAVTVKYLYGTVTNATRIDYAQWMMHAHEVHRSLEFIQTEFEEDSTGRLHMHALVQTPLKRLYKSKLNHRGFHVDIQKIPIDEIGAWLQYIVKDQFKVYAFVDE